LLARARGVPGAVPVIRGKFRGRRKNFPERPVSEATPIAARTKRRRVTLRGMGSAKALAKRQRPIT